MIQSESKKGAWVDELPVVLWCLRTTPSHATGETPFNMVYGLEAVLPAEAGLPTYINWGSKYKHLMARTYNQRMSNKQFKVGYLVLRLYSITHPKDRDKMSPKWEGPYRISRMIGPGTYKLERMNGDRIPRTWHASNLVK
ncbi:hypothetical protein LIER_39162 [Lithospermum erythrorhizon]|uniref:Uncharacterized protein n=1 Tax=Lithospermum erythrorhizon TaxID=34254 RepID=A0AAV3QDS3_LITER